MANPERSSDVAQLAYEMATARLERQEAKLNEIRSRTTLLLGAAAVATSFLAEAALDKRASDESAFTYLGFAAAVLAAFGTLFILLPRKKWWKFSANTKKIVRFYYYGDYENGAPLGIADTQAFLADELSDWHVSNEANLDSLYRYFTWAAFAVGIDLVAWLIDLLFYYEGGAA